MPGPKIQPNLTTHRSLAEAMLKRCEQYHSDIAEDIIDINTALHAMYSENPTHYSRKDEEDLTATEKTARSPNQTIRFLLSHIANTNPDVLRPNAAQMLLRQNEELESLETTINAVQETIPYEQGNIQKTMQGFLEASEPIMKKLTEKNIALNNDMNALFAQFDALPPFSKIAEPRTPVDLKVIANSRIAKPLTTADAKSSALTYIAAAMHYIETNFNAYYEIERTCGSAALGLDSKDTEKIIPFIDTLNQRINEMDNADPHNILEKARADINAIPDAVPANKALQKIRTIYSVVSPALEDFEEATLKCTEQLIPLLALFPQEIVSPKQPEQGISFSNTLSNHQQNKAEAHDKIVAAQEALQILIMAKQINLS